MYFFFQVYYVSFFVGELCSKLLHLCTTLNFIYIYLSQLFQLYIICVSVKMSL